VDLLLVGSVDLVEQVKPENVLADRDLIPVLEYLFTDPLTVDQRPVSRTEIGENELQLVRFLVVPFVYSGVSTRHQGVVHTNVGLKSAAEYNLFSLEWDRNSDQLAAQEYERGPEIAFQTFGFCHTGRVTARREGH